MSLNKKNKKEKIIEDVENNDIVTESIVTEELPKEEIKIEEDKKNKVEPVTKKEVKSIKSNKKVQTLQDFLF